jgi:hypothetical protein
VGLCCFYDLPYGVLMILVGSLGLYLLVGDCLVARNVYIHQAACMNYLDDPFLVYPLLMFPYVPDGVVRNFPR